MIMGRAAVPTGQSGRNGRAQARRRPGAVPCSALADGIARAATGVRGRTSQAITANLA